MAGLSDIFARIHYAGDVARLYNGGHLLDDDFYNGRVWEIGMKRFFPDVFGHHLEIQILPMPRNSLIYLDPSVWAQMQPAGQTSTVQGVELLPEYEVVIPPSRP